MAMPPQPSLRLMRLEHQRQAAAMVGTAQMAVKIKTAISMNTNYTIKEETK